MSTNPRLTRTPSNIAAGLHDRLPNRGRGHLDRLYRLYSPWLTARIRRRFGWDAEDVVQEAWLWIIPMSDTTDIRHPKALLLKVASNIAITRARLTRRRTELLIEATPGFAHSHAADQAHVLMMQEVVLSLPQPLRDRIVVGEMRDGAAALETLKSWNTGHPGGLSTIHANSADDVLRRVEDLITEVSTRTPRRAIAQAVDRIVHIRRTATGRKVEAVLGVEPSGEDAYAISLLA